MIQRIILTFKNFANMITKSSNVLSYAIIVSIVVLTPLFFFPVHAMNIIIGKGFFVTLLAILGLLVAGVTVLKRGSVTFSRHPLFLILAGLSLVALIGAFLSPRFSMAFWGYGFETTTWLFITVFGLIVLLAYKTVKSYDRVRILYGGLLIVFGMLALLHIIRFVAGPAAINLMVLGSATATLVGAWTDLGMFTGVVLIISTITLQLAGLTRITKWFVMTTAVVSSIFLLFMNISTIWVVLGLVSLMLVLYLFAFAYWDPVSKTYKKEKRLPWYIIVLFVLSLIGIFFGGYLNTFASRYQNIVWNDVRPSFITTVSVAQKALIHNPVTGYGPNSFSLGWSLTKPAVISGSEFASIDFTSGFSYVTSQIAMNGLLGAIVWIMFFIVLLYTLLKRIGEGFERATDRYFAVSLAALIFTIGLLAWLAVPGTLLLVLLAVCIGAFFAIFIPRQEITLSFVKDPRTSFFGILSIAVLLVGSFIGGYIIVRKLIAFIHDTRGVVHMSRNEVAAAAEDIGLAIAVAPQDIFHAQLSQLAMGDAAYLVSNVTDTNKQTSARQAQQILGIALGHAKASTQLNPMNYKNWVLLGNVYQAALGIGVVDAKEHAIQAYNEALKRSPTDALLHLNFANLALVDKDINTALKSIQDSLDIHPTRDAYLLRAQIQINQEQWSDVVTSIKQAVVLDQNNAILYAYLAAAYEKVGDMENASQIYDLIRKRFKDNDDIISKIKNTFSQNQTITQPQPSTALPPTTQIAPQKPLTKPVAPNLKK